MTMPIATQVADAITDIKGRLYAKAGELYFRKSKNGTIYQLTPPGGGGLAVVAAAPGASNINPGQVALGTVDGAYTFTLIDGANDGDQCGLVVLGADGDSVLVVGNIGGNPPSFETGYQYRAAMYIWSADEDAWFLYSLVVRPAA